MLADAKPRTPNLAPDTEPPQWPSTDATGRSTAEMAVIPGSWLYERWTELLQAGDISYDEFLDWTTPDRRHGRVARTWEGVRTLLAGLRGSGWRRVL